MADNVTKSPLVDEFKYYLDHQDEMVKRYEGKFIVIKNGEVLGAHDNELVAIAETQKSHKLGTFLIQKVSKGSQDYSQTYNSRVAFS